MPTLCSYWLTVLEEKNRVGKELLNQIRVLHFSIQMITNLVMVRNESPSLNDLKSPGLVIYHDSTKDAYALHKNLQDSLEGSIFLVEAFVADASKLVRYIDSYLLVAPPHKDRKNLIDMCVAVNDMVCALKDWKDSRLERTPIRQFND